MFIKEVTTHKELKDFIQFPKKLYHGCLHYVPPLDSAEMQALTHHPAMEFCTLKLWMAYENEEVVGRIAGIINHKCNELKGQKRAGLTPLTIILLRKLFCPPSKRGAKRTG